MTELLLKEMQEQERLIKNALVRQYLNDRKKALSIKYLLGKWVMLDELLLEIDRKKAVEKQRETTALFKQANTIIYNLINL